MPFKTIATVQETKVKLINEENGNCDTSEN